MKMYACIRVYCVQMCYWMSRLWRLNHISNTKIKSKVHVCRSICRSIYIHAYYKIDFFLHSNHTRLCVFFYSPQSAPLVSIANKHIEVYINIRSYANGFFCLYRVCNVVTILLLLLTFLTLAPSNSVHSKHWPRLFYRKIDRDRQRQRQREADGERHTELFAYPLHWCVMLFSVYTDSIVLEWFMSAFIRPPRTCVTLLDSPGLFIYPLSIYYFDFFFSRSSSTAS